MLVDMDEVRKHIKPKAHSTLCNMRKADLIDYIRCLEHNYNVAVSFNENQAKYIESLDIGKMVHCKDCKFSVQDAPYDAMECVMWRAKFGVAYTEPDGYCHKGERRTDVLPVR